MEKQLKKIQATLDVIMANQSVIVAAMGMLNDEQAKIAAKLLVNYDARVNEKLLKNK
jgi:hypothetical protein